MILLLVVNIPEFFLSHRLPIALAAQKAGFEVHIVSGPGQGQEKISSYGFKFHEISLSRSGRKPFAELYTFFALYRVIRRVRPDIIHLVTVKPVIYGGLAARLCGIKATVAAISGLGTAFVERDGWQSFVRRGLEFFYCRALGGQNTHVIFQNDDDRNVLRSMGALSVATTSLIKGSGVLLDDYSFSCEQDGIPVVTFAARLLIDKGIKEFVDAAHVLKSRGVEVQFLVAGSTDPGNLTSLSEDELASLRKSGVVEVLGYQEDIYSIFARSNLVVLPSYREGLPKVLIEAAACGRAIVTTDVPGCRDAIIPDETGILVPARDVNALAGAIQSLVNDPERRKRMGAAGRALAEREYGIERVIDAHLEIYWDLLSRSRPL